MSLRTVRAEVESSKDEPRAAGDARRSGVGASSPSGRERQRSGARPLPMIDELPPMPPGEAPVERLPSSAGSHATDNRGAAAAHATDNRGVAAAHATEAKAEAAKAVAAARAAAAQRLREAAAKAAQNRVVAPRVDNRGVAAAQATDNRGVAAAHAIEGAVPTSAPVARRRAPADLVELTPQVGEVKVSARPIRNLTIPQVVVQVEGVVVLPSQQSGQQSALPTAKLQAQRGPTLTVMSGGAGSRAASGEPGLPARSLLETLSSPDGDEGPVVPMSPSQRSAPTQALPGVVLSSQSLRHSAPEALGGVASQETPLSSRSLPGSSRSLPGSSRSLPGSSRSLPGSSRSPAEEALYRSGGVVVQSRAPQTAEDTVRRLLADRESRGSAAADPERQRRTELVEVIPAAAPAVAPRRPFRYGLLGLGAGALTLLLLRLALGPRVAPPPVSTPVTQAGEASEELSALLGRIDRALDVEDWNGALSLCNAAIKVRPQEAALAERRRRAEAELRNQFRYEGFRATAAKGNAEAALALFAELPEESLYRSKARAEAQRLREVFVASRLTEARAARRAGLCPQVLRLTQAVLAVDEGQKEARALAERCADRESRLSSAVADREGRGSAAVDHESRAPGEHPAGGAISKRARAARGPSGDPGDGAEPRERPEGTARGALRDPFAN